MNTASKNAGRRERGQVTLEFVGIFPLVLIVILICLQAFVTVVAYERVHNAARTGARTASMGRDGTNAAWGALPGWLIKEPRLPLCEDNDRPVEDGCLETYSCVQDGEKEQREKTCIDIRFASESVDDSVTSGVRATVRTEIPLLFPGAPLVFPIEVSVEMPT